QEDVDAAVSKPGILARQLPHRCQHRSILRRHLRLVPHRRSGHPDQRTRPPHRNPAMTRELHLRSARLCAHHFFALISFITSSSRSRSATIFLSRPFSNSSCFRRLTSEASSDPNFLRHRYSVCSLIACFLAVAGTPPASDSRTIRTICSSLNLDFFMV